MVETRVITQALVKYGNKYLIGKRAATKKFAPNKWELITGFIDRNESVEQIILRELKEETQLDGKIVKTADPYVMQDKEARWIVIPFVVESKSDKFVRNEKDHSKLKWVSVQELEEYKDIADDLRELRKRKLL